MTCYGLAGSTSGKLSSATGHQKVLYPCGLILLDYDYTNRVAANGYVCALTGGGTIKSIVYSAGTHAAPVAPTCIHVVTHEVAATALILMPLWCEWTIQGVKDVPLDIKFYHKAVTADYVYASPGTVPTLSIRDPNKPYGSDLLGTAGTAAYNNNATWQTLTPAYTPTVTGPLTIRYSAATPAASGTSWFFWTQTFAATGSSVAINRGIRTGGAL